MVPFMNVKLQFINLVMLIKMYLAAKYIVKRENTSIMLTHKLPLYIVQNRTNLQVCVCVLLSVVFRLYHTQLNC